MDDISVDLDRKYYIRNGNVLPVKGEIYLQFPTSVF